MQLNGTPVTSHDPRVGLSNFLSFLSTLDRPVLAAHNCTNFDSKVLYNALMKFDLVPHFKSVCLGFLDTLPLFKHTFPKQPSYKLDRLVKALLDQDYDAHNAIEDCKALQELVKLSVSMNTSVSKYSFTAHYVPESFQFVSNKNANLPSFQPVVESKKLAKSAAERLASSGLALRHVRLAFERGSSDGVVVLLQEKDKYG